MIKAILFDADGVTNSSKMFSEELEKEFGIKNEVMAAFFKRDFPKCIIGQADLKEILNKHINEWGWKNTVDEFISFWLRSEHEINEPLLNHIATLRKKGISCHIATNQEKYRTEYMKKDMGFDDAFDSIYSSCQIGYKKPDQEYFDYIFNDLKKILPIEKNEIMFWDDNQENVDGASKFGFDSHLYRNLDDFEKVVKKFQLIP